VSSSRRQQASAEARLESARNRAAEKIEELEALEADLQDAVIEIDDEWSSKADAVEPVEIPLEKSDITVEEPVLAWLPIER
jgi:peptidoglycan hydrolase CwlO-like protein